MTVVRHPSTTPEDRIISWWDRQLDEPASSEIELNFRICGDRSNKQQQYLSELTPLIPKHDWSRPTPLSFYLPINVPADEEKVQSKEKSKSPASPLPPSPPPATPELSPFPLA